MSSTRLYLQALAAQPDFTGEITDSLAARLTLATDNSIYQVLPAAVIYPRSVTDIQLLLQLAKQEAYRHVTFTPRGGGTGTDGQTLTSGIMVDVSRHMHHILEINQTEQWVRVQPGVVLDQLNEALTPTGTFFAPNVSPSNRATVGGMFNTDACGKGSCCYGRTSDHVLAVSCVFSDGTGWQSLEVDLARLAELKQLPGVVGDVYRVVDEEVTTHAAEIKRQFPKIPRHMTGYNLAKVYNDQRKTFNLNYLLSGAEGTLVFITELKLRLTKKPDYLHLLAISYGSFDAALRAANMLAANAPTAIETIDDKILWVAKEDEIFARVKPILDPLDENLPVQAINFIEFSGDDQSLLAQKIQMLCHQLACEQKAGRILSYIHTQDAKEIAALWDLRKKSVGLLGNLPGNRRPVPFVEDTAVPPAHLADYVAEFRQLLESYGLDYGMFGHVDAGCLHVRPALDLTQETDAALVPEITAKVSALVKKYGGVLWGEHGMGFRSRLAKDYFGETLYQALRRIKTAFDPNNQLNPGKVASSLKQEVELVKVEGPLRGEFDRQIPEAVRMEYQPALRCNGNAQCFDYQPHSVMCPSYRVTRDRRHSPKGRATVFREWLRQRAKGKADPVFEKEIYEVMQGCLGCKACASSCPVKVNIPQIKSVYLHHYHQTQVRSKRDRFIKQVEQRLYYQTKWPALSNLLSRSRFGQRYLQKLGLVDLPKLKRKEAKLPLFSWRRYQALPAKDQQRLVVLLPDIFTLAVEPEVLSLAKEVLSRLGYLVWQMPWRENGKPKHVLGFLDAFKQVVERNERVYAKYHQAGIALIGLDPSMTVVYRDEYRAILEREPAFKIPLLSEWLAEPERLAKLAKLSVSKVQKVKLFPHCTEKALAPGSVSGWQKIFQAVNMPCEVVSVGCCGMAGLYGHETEHAESSRQLFEMSWQARLEAGDSEVRQVATGFSCRCQVKRFAKLEICHPLAMLVC